MTESGQLTANQPGNAGERSLLAEARKLSSRVSRAAVDALQECATHSEARASAESWVARFVIT